MTEIPRYSYEDLRKKADEFLRIYNPSGAIPVPIEEIVEFEFNINIVPVLALQNEWVKRIKGKGVSLKQNWDFAWELITAHLGKAFQVSSSVIEKRLDKDGIKENYK